jgi:hypothetical protein
MTGEEHVEEMLWIAHKKESYTELTRLASQLRLENVKLSFSDSIYKAFYMMELDFNEVEI